MDNLSAHKGERIRTLIESKGPHLLFLPAYSPDFNRIQRRSILLTRIRAWSRLPAISSSIEGVACRFNSYDRRCRGSLLQAEELPKEGQSEHQRVTA
jgi:transposase